MASVPSITPWCPAPAAATPEAFRERGIEQIPPDGFLAATVPAALDAWCLLLERFGTRRLRDVLAPARALADRGFPMYPFLRGLMGRWVPFRQVTQDALLWAVESMGFAADPHTVDHVMAAYDLATAYPDVLPTLRTLTDAHHSCVILTNGSRDMVSLAVEATDVERYLDAVISVDAVERFKPDPLVYGLVALTT